MRKYSIAMSIRTVCLILLVVIPEWWRYIFGVGAVILPYIAVVLANVGASGASAPVNPGLPNQLAIEPTRGMTEDGRRTCSSAGCRADATRRIEWRNPRIHAADRRKVWLACDAHVRPLLEFLVARAFPVEVLPFDSAG